MRRALQMSSLLALFCLYLALSLASFSQRRLLNYSVSSASSRVILSQTPDNHHLCRQTSECSSHIPSDCSVDTELPGAAVISHRSLASGFRFYVSLLPCSLASSSRKFRINNHHLCCQQPEHSSYILSDCSVALSCRPFVSFPAVVPCQKECGALYGVGVHQISD
jgi:hypothetical protein